MLPGIDKMKEKTAKEQILGRKNRRIDQITAYQNLRNLYDHTEIENLEQIENDLETVGINYKSYTEHNTRDQDGQRWMSRINFQELHQELENLQVEDLLIGFSEYKLVELDLSWGGPSDSILLKVDKETNEIISGKYQFAKWFDVEERFDVEEIYLSCDELELIESTFYLGE